MPTMTREPFAAVLLAALAAVADCADREAGPAGEVGAAAWRDAWDRCWGRRTP